MMPFDDDEEESELYSKGEGGKLKGENLSCTSLYLKSLRAKYFEVNKRWRHHQSRQLRHGTGGEGNILQPPAPVVSDATTLKTVGATDLTTTYSVCTRRVFGGIDHQTQALRSEVRCFYHKATNGLFNFI
ncbi:hypothetical protein TNCV_2022941 [Trichonephila clavipes]|nr:hypothetical protein TNCV_2022941 [Trichonephila clavipes]